MSNQSLSEPNAYSKTVEASFTPISEFPHLLNLNSKYDLIKKLSFEDFENGLNPLEPILLKKLEGKYNLLRAFHSQVVSYDYTYNKAHTVKQQQEMLQKIYSKALDYFSTGVFKKEHIYSFIQNKHLLSQKHTAIFVKQCIDAGILSLKDTVLLSGYPLQQNSVEVPIVFALPARYVKPFFEAYGAEAMKELKVNVYKSYPSNPIKEHPDNILKSLSYLEYAQVYKDKAALALCEEYYKDDKLAVEQKNMDYILGDTLGPREKIKRLTEEIKKHNSLLPQYLEDPRIEKLLTIKRSGKNLLFFAVDTKNFAVLDTMLGMSFFKNNIDATDNFSRCAVGYAAHKGQVSVEKYLIDNNYYSIDSFGEYQTRTETYHLNNRTKNDFKYQVNASDLSDHSCIVLMEKGLKLDPAYLIMNKNIEAYTKTLAIQPEILSSPYLLDNIEFLSEEWCEKSYHPYGGHYRTYIPTQNHIPIVLETLRFMQNSNNSKYQTMSTYVEEKFLKSLSKIGQANTAGFAMNLYLKYFPGKEKKLIASINGLTNNWAIKFDKKNIEEELKKFLKSMDKPIQKKEEALTSTPARRLNKI